MEGASDYCEMPEEIIFEGVGQRIARRCTKKNFVGNSWEYIVRTDWMSINAEFQKHVYQELLQVLLKVVFASSLPKTPEILQWCDGWQYVNDDAGTEFSKVGSLVILVETCGTDFVNDTREPRWSLFWNLGLINS